MLTKKPLAAVFDLDGTLLDTIEDLKDLMNGTLLAHGLPLLDREGIRQAIGSGSREFMKMSIPKSLRDEENVDRLLAFYRSQKPRGEGVKTKPFEGVSRLLDFLKEKGIRAAVLTNKPQKPAEKLIARYFPDYPFEMVIGQIEGRPNKPAPAPLMEILNFMGITNADALLIGDGDADCLAAKNAGVPFAAALWGYRTKEELTNAGARDFYNSPKELLSALKEVCR
jgi:phosphoglycolate phosphatase